MQVKTSDGFEATVRTYYREKRIHRLLTLKNPRYYRMNYKEKRKLRLFSRDSFLRIAVTCIAIPICTFPSWGLMKNGPQPVKMLLSALGLILAVEISDFVWLKLHRAFDFFLDWVLPFSLLALLVIGFIGMKYFNLRETIGERWTKFHAQVNHDLQKKHESVMMLPMAGENWRFLINDGKLARVSFAEAETYCRSLGEGWSLPAAGVYSGLKPAPEMPRHEYIWESGGVRAAGFSKTINSNPTTFTMRQGGGGLYVTLCVKANR